MGEFTRLPLFVIPLTVGLTDMKWYVNMGLCQ